jgi:hypothetical protein
MLCFTTSLSICLRLGLGQHIWNLEQGHTRIKGFIQVSFFSIGTEGKGRADGEQQALISQTSYMLAMGSIKISFAYQLLPIIPSLRWRKGMWYFILLLALYYLVATLSIVFNCIPVSYSWTRLEYLWDPNYDPANPPKGKCTDLALLHICVQGKRNLAAVDGA